MFFILSKTLYFLAMPSTWLVLLLALGLWWRKKKRGKWALWGSLLLFWLCANPLAINFLWQQWEWPPQPMAALSKHKVAVLLTGVTRPKQQPKDRVHYHRGADRMLHSLQLYKMQKFEALIISGANTIEWDGTYQNERSGMAESFRWAGVPDSVLFLETQARNTRENARYTAEFLKTHFPAHRGKVLLLTSAFHMRRAVGCFRAAGVEVQPFATDFWSSPEEELLPGHFFPSAEHFFMAEKLAHEVLGYVVYWVLGYVE
jgi:uncharacterized SAM-binding protein YcdF (DUF218 family)